MPLGWGLLRRAGGQVDRRDARQARVAGRPRDAGDARNDPRRVYTYHLVYFVYLFVYFCFGGRRQIAGGAELEGVVGGRSGAGASEQKPQGVLPEARGA